MSSLMEKAYTSIRRNLLRSRGSRGSISHYSHGQPASLGQPASRVADGSGLITPARKREIAVKAPTLSACMNTVIDYVSQTDIQVKHLEPSQQADKNKVQYITDFLNRPNQKDTRKHFLESIYRDLFVLGYAAVEIERDSRGKAANLHVLDAARLAIDYDQHGSITGYAMNDANGVPISGSDGRHAWTPEDIILFRRDAESGSVYPLSRLDQLFACAVIENLMLHFIGSKFTEGNIPYGVLSLGDLTDQELKVAIQQWNEQTRSNQHRIILTGSRGSMDWTEFGYAIRDMDVSGLLGAVRSRMMAILGVTDNELGQSGDVNKANGFNLSYTFKRRAIDPLLREFTGTFTRRFVWDDLQLLDLSIEYNEIDSRDDLLQGQVDELKLRNGFASINEIRNSTGQPSIPGGDVHVVIVGQTIIPVSMLHDYALAQVEALKRPGSTPSTAPDKDTPRKPASDIPTKPRGAVQALRNAGVRKEDSV